MFRKIVTELSYSPALAGRLSEYIRYIRQEKLRREVGLILLVLVLIIQLFATSFPPESANADNTSALTSTSLQSMNEYITTYYDQNIEGTRDFATSLGITRPELLSATLTTISPASDLIAWSTRSHGDGTDRTYTFFNTSSLRQQTQYFSPLLSSSLTLPDAANEPLIAYTGMSSTAGWFALLKDTGNLITHPLHQNQTTCADSSTAEVSLDNADPTCSKNVHSLLSAYDITTSSAINYHVAQPSDRIMYTLTVKNTGSTAVKIPLHIALGDILEYAQVLDKGGGTLDSETKTLDWGKQDIQAGTELSRSFIVQLAPIIPSTAQGSYNLASYDCVMSTSFGTAMRVPVHCPFTKSIEQTIHTFPPLSPTLGTSLTVTIISIAAYFYLRSRQFLAELHHIQHNQSGSL